MNNYNFPFSIFIYFFLTLIFIYFLFINIYHYFLIFSICILQFFRKGGRLGQKTMKKQKKKRIQSFRFDFEVFRRFDIRFLSQLDIRRIIALKENVY